MTVVRGIWFDASEAEYLMWSINPTAETLVLLIIVPVTKYGCVGTNTSKMDQPDETGLKQRRSSSAARRDRAGYYWLFSNCALQIKHCQVPTIVIINSKNWKHSTYRI